MNFNKNIGAVSFPPFYLIFCSIFRKFYLNAIDLNRFAKWLIQYAEEFLKNPILFIVKYRTLQQFKIEKGNRTGVSHRYKKLSLPCSRNNLFGFNSHRQLFQVFLTLMLMDFRYLSSLWFEHFRPLFKKRISTNGLRLSLSNIIQLLFSSLFDIRTNVYALKDLRLTDKFLMGWRVW